jgi:hypothetical protein
MAKIKRKTRLKIKPAHGNTKIPFFLTATSGNTKTGNVPTMWIGSNREQVARSCKDSGCPLLPTEKGGTFDVDKEKLNGRSPCYAWAGTVQMGGQSMWKAIKKVGEVAYSTTEALKKSAFSARCVRVTAWGDVVSLRDDQVQGFLEDLAQHNAEYRNRKSFLRILGYTHAWRNARVAKWWKSRLMASVHSLEEADEAFDQGWRPAAEINVDGDPGKVMVTPKGRKLLVCPHLLSEDQKRKITPDCNDCQWCVVEKNDATFGIVFPNHK